MLFRSPQILFDLKYPLPPTPLGGHLDPTHADLLQQISGQTQTKMSVTHIKSLLVAPPLQSPPNFLHAASLAKHVKPVVVIPVWEAVSPLRAHYAACSH